MVVWKDSRLPFISKQPEYLAPRGWDDGHYSENMVTGRPTIELLDPRKQPSCYNRCGERWARNSFFSRNPAVVAGVSSHSGGPPGEEQYHPMIDTNRLKTAKNGLKHP